MFVLGTAGHVDHGKSNLIKWLTNIEPDRLPDEKKRGMTIDLNFVYLNTRFGQVGIIDVPGHQRFIKNMITGVSEIDGALFCVAADDGWMPQSEEHLRILHGLGVTQFLLVVTKCDRVDSERVAAVKADAKARIERVVKKPIPTIDRCVDLSEFKSMLEVWLTQFNSPRDIGSPRLWVDRAFHPKGLGTVVTGTLREGVIRVGDLVKVWPFETCKIMGIQCYQSEVSQIGPGHRVAIRLSNADSIQRGNLLACSPHISKVFDARVDEWKLKNQQCRLQLGSFSILAVVIPISHQLIRVKTAEIPIRFGDRFVLRSFGGEKTLSVGQVLDPSPVNRLKENLKILESIKGVEDFVELRLKSGIVNIDDLRSQIALNEVQIAELCHKAHRVGDTFVDEKLWEKWKEAVKDEIQKDSVNPQTFAAQIGIPEGIVRAILADLQKSEKIEARSYGFVMKTAVVKNPFTFPHGLPRKRSELVGDSPALRLTVKKLLGDGALVLMGDHVLERKKFDEYKARVLGELKIKSKLPTSEAKSILNLSRNHTVLVLERMDADRLTYLKDGVRRLLRG